MEENNLNSVLQAIKELSTKIDILNKKEKIQPAKSEELKDLLGALAKAQGEIKTAGLTAVNPYFKSSYSDMAEIVRVSRPALTKNGLSVIQQILPNNDGQNILHTILGHESGQWIESRMRILPPKPDIQSLGSYITYLKRYAYAAIIGVVSSDEDDDGERSMSDIRHETAKGTKLNTKYNPKDQSYESITKEQLEELEYELGEYTDIAEMILDGLKIQSLADMPKSKYLPAIKRIREIKNLREGK